VKVTACQHIISIVDVLVSRPRDLTRFYFPLVTAQMHNFTRPRLEAQSDSEGGRDTRTRVELELLDEHMISLFDH